MEFIGPFTFNGIRFLLGSIILIPFLISKKNQQPSNNINDARRPPQNFFFKGIVTGLVLFCGASLQQIGIVFTTAGKAGFITGLYVIIVPFLGLFWGKPSKKGTWIGAVLAIGGLYFLSVKGSNNIVRGDLLVLVGAFFWALHVHLIDWLVEKSSAIKLAFLQFLTCAILSIFVSIFVEDISIEKVMKVSIPIIYAGPISVGIGYTLQVMAQTEAHPSHAAIILSLEAVFAALGGWVILREFLSFQEILGCSLMLVGMISSVVNFEISKATQETFSKETDR